MGCHIGWRWQAGSSAWLLPSTAPAPNGGSQVKGFFWVRWAVPWDAGPAAGGVGWKLEKGRDSRDKAEKWDKHNRCPQAVPAGPEQPVISTWTPTKSSYQESHGWRREGKHKRKYTFRGWTPDFSVFLSLSLSSLFFSCRTLPGRKWLLENRERRRQTLLWNYLTSQNELHLKSFKWDLGVFNCSTGT